MILFSRYFSILEEAENLSKEDIISLIKDELDSMDAEELQLAGDYIYDEYLVFEPGEEEPELDSNYEETDFEGDYTVDELVEIIDLLDDESLEDLLIDLSDEEHIDETVATRMNVGNLNRKRRKFMSNSVSDLRKTSAARKRYNNAHRAQRKAYYRANKTRISKYQHDYRQKVAKHKHIKKIRALA